MTEARHGIESIWRSENRAWRLLRIVLLWSGAVLLAFAFDGIRAQETETAAEPASLGEALLAEESERELAEAEAARAAAETERQRLIAAEYALLKPVSEAIEAQAARMQKEAAAIELIETDALGWAGQVAALDTAPGSEAAADILYGDLIVALREVRGDLATALEWNGKASGTTVEIPPVNPALLAGDGAGAELFEYYRSLTSSAQRLAAREPILRRARTDALYNAMLTMNDARLALIPALSSGLRSRITGFSDEGFAQATREAKQIVLTARYNVATGFAGIKAFGSDLIEFRPGQIVALFEILLAILVFRVWRRAGDPVLAELQHSQEARKPPTLMSTFLAWLARLYRHSRRPIDWLLLLVFVGWLFPRLFAPAAMALAYSLACWVLGGAALVQLIDAMAQGRSGDDPRAALRQRSLRLVASVVIGVGLVLTLTASAVGHGAIYSWVLTFCWLLAIPVILILATWWRERIETLAGLGASSNKVLAWASRNTGGISGAIGRVAAGFVLLAQGARVIVARRIRQLSLIREILGQRARMKASEQVIADEKSGRYFALTEEQIARLAPHGRPLDGGKRDLAAVGISGQPMPGQAMAIVGDRGHGKSTVLAQLAETSGLPAIFIEAKSAEDDGILPRLAEGLGCEAEPRAIAQALKAKPHCIAIDDVQRIIVPAIGGLARFDTVLDLAQRTEGATCWLFAIGEATWPFLSRARGDRPLFDHEIHLLPWRVEQIRAMIERRTAAAGIEPDFGLALESAGTMLFEEEIEPEERARRAYFAALTEEAAGNPAVALDLWRRSLFEDRDSGKVVVRTHKAPDAARLATMPLNTLFVLRSILQMDIATFRQIALATDLPFKRVHETLRACAKLGVIEEPGASYRINLFWLQDVKRILLAQNLIVGRRP